MALLVPQKEREIACEPPSVAKTEQKAKVEAKQRLKTVV